MARSKAIRVKVLKAAEQNSVRVSCNGRDADLPIDGKFHPIHPDLIGALADSSVEFEIENADATGGNAAAGGAAGLGGSAASPKRRRRAPSKKKAKR